MRTIAICCGMVLFVATGCGQSGPPKFPVQGQVRFEGAPIPNGTMTLIPRSSEARTTVAPIVEGKYKAEVTEGEWNVNIQAVRESGPVNPALGEAPREQYIPDKYNGQSTLSIKVPSEQSDFNFDLEP